MEHRARRTRRARTAAAALAVVTALAGCGSRVSAADVLAGAGGTPVTVTLPPGLLPQPQHLDAPAAPAQRTPAAAAGPAANPLASIPSTRTSNVQHPAAHPTRGPLAPELPGTTTSATSPCSRPSTPIPIGQVGTFSGVVGAITAAARTAVATWASDVNARGGIACHPVQLFVKDDGADPARAAAAVAELATGNHVIALVGNIVPFSVAGFRPAIEKAGIPAVGGDTIAPEWHHSPLMFSQGPTTEDQLVLAVRAGVVLGGHTHLGLVYCVEVATCTYADKFLRDGGARAGGADLVYDAPISITQTDYTAQCLNARNAGVDLLLLGMDGAAMARLARSCEAIGYRPLLLTGAGTFSLKNTEDPTLRSFGMVTGSPVAPWVATDTPGLRAFHAAMNRYAPGTDVDGEAVIGWSSGKLLEAAIAALTPAERAQSLSAAIIVRGLQRLHNETLDGLAAGLSYAPDPVHATGRACLYVLRLTTTGWTAPRGSKPLCR